MTATAHESKSLEVRADVACLEELQSTRRQIITDIAPLELLYGSGGDRWTATRRRHRDGIARLTRDEMFEKWRNAGAKPGEWKEPSEALLERHANSDKRHTDFVDETESAFPRWLSLKNELGEIEEKIRSREIELTIFNSEIRLSR